MMKITITKSGLAVIGRRGFQKAGREGIARAAIHWWRTFLPLHFQMIAYIRYRYQSRDPATNRKKADKLPFLEGVGDQTPAIGEVLPNVYSGRSRERALSHYHIEVTAPNYQTAHADVIIDAPGFNFTAGKRIDSRDEVTRDTPQELKTLERLFGEGWDDSLTAQGLTAPKQTRTYGGSAA